MFEFKAYTIYGQLVSFDGSTAVQSSTFKNSLKYAASKAVDGSITTFSHINDNNAFWQVDLAQAQQISFVSIVNRWCGSSSDPSGCLCRLTNATISLLDSQQEVVESACLGSTCADLNPGLNFDLCVSNSSQLDGFADNI